MQSCPQALGSAPDWRNRECLSLFISFWLISPFPEKKSSLQSTHDPTRTNERKVLVLVLPLPLHFPWSHHRTLWIFQSRSHAALATQFGYFYLPPHESFPPVWSNPGCKFADSAPGTVSSPLFPGAKSHSMIANNNYGLSFPNHAAFPGKLLPQGCCGRAPGDVSAHPEPWKSWRPLRLSTQDSA